MTGLEGGLEGIKTLSGWDVPNYALMKIVITAIRQPSVVGEFVREYPAVYSTPVSVIELAQELQTLSTLIQVHATPEVIVSLCDQILPN